jgi:ATP-dependent RNA circularization protein (DNA/RNA ligase family)
MLAEMAISAEDLFKLIENRQVSRETGIKLIENYGVRQQRIALSELQEEYGGYAEEIALILKRINARLDELVRQIMEAEF